MHLVKCCHKRTYLQDPVIRDIVVHYDFADAIKPYIKSNIKYYSIPHYFILKAIHPRISIMQHMMFSFNQTLLPVPTDKSISSRSELFDNLVDSINLSKSFSILNGQFAVREKFGFTSSGKVKRKAIDNTANLNKEAISNQSQIETTFENDDDDDSSIASMLFGNKKRSEDLTTVNELLPSLETLSFQSVIQQEKRMDDEAQGKKPKNTKTYRQTPYISDIRKTLHKTSNADKGYIVWLSSKRTISEKTDNNHWRDLIKPKPFDYKEILSQIDLIIAEEAAKLDTLNELSILPSSYNENNVKHAQAQRRSESNGSGEVMSSDPFSVRNRRVYKTAAEIATSAQWVLNQVKNGIIGNNINQLEFNDDLVSNFLSVTLNQKEIKWYESRDTAEKVLRLAQNEYDNAPEWEPLPVNNLSSEDLAKIQEEESKFKAHVEIAEALGRDALVKLGHNFKDGDQVVAYGRNELSESIQIISNALKDVRAKGQSKQNTLKKPKEIKYYVCDIDSCDHIVCSADKVKCSDEFCMCNSFRKGLRYCSDHFIHQSHFALKKRFKRQEVESAKLTIKPKDNKNIPESSLSKMKNKINNKSTKDSNSFNNINTSPPVLQNKKLSDKNKRSIIDIITSNTEKTINNINLENKKQKTVSIQAVSSSKVNNDEKSEIIKVSEVDNSKYYFTGAESRINKKRKNDSDSSRRCEIMLKTGNESEEDFIKSCLYKLTDDQIYQLHDKLPSDHFFKSNNGLFKLFFKIRNTLASNNFQPVNLVELIKFPMYFENLKILAINVFKIDIQIGKLLNTDNWKTTNLSKNKHLKDQFINKFVECFLDKYYNNN